METYQFVGLVLWIAILAFCIFAAFQASQYTDEKWQQVGQNKLLVILGCALGGLCCSVVGLIFGLWFLLSIKPRLDALR